MDEKYTGLKKQLSELCGLKPEQILLAEVHSSNIKVRRKKPNVCCNMVLVFLFVVSVHQHTSPFFLTLSFAYKNCEII